MSPKNWREKKEQHKAEQKEKQERFRIQRIVEKHALIQKSLFVSDEESNVDGDNDNKKRKRE